MTRRLPTFAPFLVALLLLLTATATAIADESAVPPAGETAPAGGAEEAAPEPMSVEFPRGHATLVGERALVFVRCSGLASETCEGTLVLHGIGGTHKVPYSIERGDSQGLTVPLGTETAVKRGSRARVVARTLQLTGGLVRTSRVLKVR